MRIEKVINRIANVIVRLFNEAHSPSTTLREYHKIATDINAILYRIQQDHGGDTVMTVVYLASLTAKYSFGPLEPSLAAELISRGCVSHKSGVLRPVAPRWEISTFF